MLIEDVLKVVGFDRRKEVEQFFTDNYGKLIKVIPSSEPEANRRDLMQMGVSYDDNGMPTFTYLYAQEPPWPVMSRSQAIEAGLHKHWTGKPCKHGHVAQRYVKGGACCDCAKINQRIRSSPTHTTLTIICHKDDAATLQQMADMLKQGRTNAHNNT